MDGKRRREKGGTTRRGGSRGGRSGGVPFLSHLLQLLHHEFASAGGLNLGEEPGQTNIPHLLQGTQETCLEEHLEEEQRRRGRGEERKGREWREGGDDGSDTTSNSCTSSRAISIIRKYLVP